MHMINVVNIQKILIQNILKRRTSSSSIRISRNV